MVIIPPRPDGQWDQHDKGYENERAHSRLRRSIHGSWRLGLAVMSSSKAMDSSVMNTASAMVKMITCPLPLTWPSVGGDAFVCASRRYRI
jgi:hypothetical protein